jgi:hemolysin III
MESLGGFLSSTKTVPEYTVSEEVAHSLTHGLGAILSVVALVLMVIRSVSDDIPLGIVATTVFGASLITLYTSSTLYHAFPWPRVKKLFQTFDHLAIYALIAGSYTPFALVTLGGGMGWFLFGLIWTIAVSGIVFEIVTKGRRNKIALIFYLGMGWIGVFFFKMLSELLSTWGLALLILGGVLYSVGVIFYAVKRIPYNHAVWHLFVLGGSICHFLCIFSYVLIPQQ